LLHFFFKPFTSLPSSSSFTFLSIPPSFGSDSAGLTASEREEASFVFISGFVIPLMKLIHHTCIILSVCKPAMII
jgi:hypothetical protein